MSARLNPRIELNLWLANHEVNLRVEQPALRHFTRGYKIIESSFELLDFYSMK